MVVLMVEKDLKVLHTLRKEILSSALLEIKGMSISPKFNAFVVRNMAIIDQIVELNCIKKTFEHAHYADEVQEK